MVATNEGPRLFGLFRLIGPFGPMPIWRWDGTTWLDETTGTVPDTAPESRFSFAAAYHAQLDRVVLTGGSSLDATSWSFGGGAWTQGTDAPGMRIAPAAAYDAMAEQVVLFGGRDDAGPEAFPTTTWSWNGGAWTEANLPAPVGRQTHALAYDAAREEVVLFGGGNIAEDIVFRDTWTYRGGTWTDVDPANSPPPLVGHTMTYDPKSDLIVLFGGDSGPVLENNIWTWDGTDWRLPFVTGERPVRRAFHMASWDAVNEGVLVFGGMQTGMAEGLDDTWLFRFVDVDAATGSCCGDGVCQFPERDPTLPAQACPADCGL